MFDRLLERFPFLKQFMKFVVVGFINTGLDFLILNIEMFLTGITSGPWMFVQNSLSFTVATANSYYLNKRWTFSDESQEGDASKFSQFITISIIGALINGGIVYAVTSYVTPMFGINPQLWANLAKVGATGISLIWNFLGYKFIVFKK